MGIKKVETESLAFDFGDGKGHVSAHRHINQVLVRGSGAKKGERNNVVGGWVADTATVDPSAMVSENARVYGWATVRKGCFVKDNAEVYGDAVMYEHTLIGGNSKLGGLSELQQGALLGETHIGSDDFDRKIDEKHKWGQINHWSDIKFPKVPIRRVVTGEKPEEWQCDAYFRGGYAGYLYMSDKTDGKWRADKGVLKMLNGRIGKQQYQDILDHNSFINVPEIEVAQTALLNIYLEGKEDKHPRFAE